MALTLSNQASKALALGSYFVSGVLAINAAQLLGGPLTLINKEWYNAWVAYTKQSFGLLITTLTQYWAPTIIRISGDKSVRGQLLKSTDGELICLFPERMVMIANHQIYTDWLYLWWIAYCNGMHGRIFIILKESLRRIPVIGWGMQLYQFIFLKRNWEKDKPHLSERMQKLNRSTDPMWLLMFPEGTNLADSTRESSKKWAKKNGIQDMKHCLLPRSTGLQFCLQELHKTVEYVYDCTIAYEGVPYGEYAQDIFTLRAAYYEGKPPKSVNMYWRRFAVKDIPLDNTKAFDSWIISRWREKDNLLEYFMQNGRFPADTGVETGLQGETLRGAGHIEAEVKTNAWYHGLQIFAPVGLLALVLYAFYGALPKRMVKHLKAKNTKAILKEVETLQKGKIGSLADRFLGTTASNNAIEAPPTVAAKRPVDVTAKPARAPTRKPASAAPAAAHKARPRSSIIRRAPSPVYKTVHLPKVTRSKRPATVPAARPRSPIIRKAPIKRTTSIMKKPASRPSSRGVTRKVTTQPGQKKSPSSNKATSRSSQAKPASKTQHRPTVITPLKKTGLSKSNPARVFKTAVRATSPRAVPKAGKSKPVAKVPAKTAGKPLTPNPVATNTARKPIVRTQALQKPPVKPAGQKKLANQAPKPTLSPVPVGSSGSKLKSLQTPAAVVSQKKPAMSSPTAPTKLASSPVKLAVKPIQQVQRPAKSALPKLEPPKSGPPKLGPASSKASTTIKKPVSTTVTRTPVKTSNTAAPKLLQQQVKKPVANAPPTQPKVSPASSNSQPPKLSVSKTPNKSVTATIKPAQPQNPQVASKPAVTPVKAPTSVAPSTAPKAVPSKAAKLASVSGAPTAKPTIEPVASKPSAPTTAKAAPTKLATTPKPVQQQQQKQKPTLGPIKIPAPSRTSTALPSPALSTSTARTAFSRGTSYGGTATPATTVPPTPYLGASRGKVNMSSRASVISRL